MRTKLWKLVHCAKGEGGEVTYLECAITGWHTEHNRHETVTDKTRSKGRRGNFFLGRGNLFSALLEERGN